MNAQLFHAGDKVVVIGNVNDDENNIGWWDDMDDMVGEIFTIDIINEEDDGTFIYKLEEDEDRWWFDEDWLRLYGVLEVDTHELDSFFGDFGGE